MVMYARWLVCLVCKQSVCVYEIFSKRRLSVSVRLEIESRSVSLQLNSQRQGSVLNCWIMEVVTLLYSCYTETPWLLDLLI